MIEENYIEVEKFDDFCENQNKLINILNHRMTKMEVDVNWIKRIITIQTTVMSGIFLSILALVFKSIFL